MWVVVLEGGFAVTILNEKAGGLNGIKVSTINKGH